MIGSQASWGSSFVRWRALMIGLPKGVMKRGVREAFGVLFVISVCVRSSVVRSGDLDRDGEWYCEGGDEIAGDGASETGLGVVGFELISTTSPIFLCKFLSFFDYFFLELYSKYSSILPLCCPQIKSSHLSLDFWCIYSPCVQAFS